jgi:hypothetical protein
MCEFDESVRAWAVSVLLRSEQPCQFWLIWMGG